MPTDPEPDIDLKKIHEVILEQETEEEPVTKKAKKKKKPREQFTTVEDEEASSSVKKKKKGKKSNQEGIAKKAKKKGGKKTERVHEGREEASPELFVNQENDTPMENVTPQETLATNEGKINAKKAKKKKEPVSLEPEDKSQELLANEEGDNAIESVGERSDVIDEESGEICAEVTLVTPAPLGDSPPEAAVKTVLIKAPGSRSSKIIYCIGIAVVVYMVVIALAVALTLILRSKQDGLAPAQITLENDNGQVESTRGPTVTPVATTLSPTLTPFSLPTFTPVATPTVSPVSNPTRSPVGLTAAPTEQDDPDFSLFLPGGGSAPTVPPTNTVTSAIQDVIEAMNPTTSPVDSQLEDTTQQQPTSQPTMDPTVRPTAGLTFEPTLQTTISPTSSPSVGVLQPTQPFIPDWSRAYVFSCSESDCIALPREECFAITGSEGIFWVDTLLDFQDGWEITFLVEVSGLRSNTLNGVALPEVSFGEAELSVVELDSDIVRDLQDGEAHLFRVLWDPNQDSLFEFSIDNTVQLSENLPLPISYVFGSSFAKVGLGQPNLGGLDRLVACFQDVNLRIL